MIIGLTGKYAAGKGTVAAMLVEDGFTYHSLSDILREELAARGTPESREALTSIGNELRAAGGPGVLANRLTARLVDGQRHVVDSIRNPSEVVALREAPGFFLIGVDADPRVRFKRLLERSRIGDPTDYETFQRLEAAETESDDPNKQQLAQTFALADDVVDNGGSIADLAEALSVVLRRRTASS